MGCSRATTRPPARSPPFPYTTLFRSLVALVERATLPPGPGARTYQAKRSEEHTSELQSRFDLVCRLLIERKNRLLAAAGIAYAIYVAWSRFAAKARIVGHRDVTPPTV